MCLDDFYLKRTESNQTFPVSSFSFKVHNVACQRKAPSLIYMCDSMPHVIIHHYTKPLEHDTMWEKRVSSRRLSAPFEGCLLRWFLLIPSPPPPPPHEPNPQPSYSSCLRYRMPNLRKEHTTTEGKRDKERGGTKRGVVDKFNSISTYGWRSKLIYIQLSVLSA